MLKQIENLKVKVKQLEELSCEFEKRLYQQEKQTNGEWLSILKKSQLEIAEMKSTINYLPNMHKELIEQENLIRQKGSLKKLQKLEKKKQKLLDSVIGFAQICEILEDNLRITLSKL